jgi:hypothetical protein
MGILEWLGAHLLAPLVNLYRAIQARPRPDVRIVDLAPTGGGTYVDFSVLVQNYGTQPTRVTVSARVGDQEVQVVTPIVDLLVNSPPTPVSIHIPRPNVGDLVEQFNNEPSLYDKTLRVEVTDAKRTRSAEWHEEVYTPETNPERYAIQQRNWRIFRGEETPEDMRALHREERIKRMENPDDYPPDYEWS